MDKNAKNSAFVNQELGYAERLNKLIIPLVEQDAVPEGLLAVKNIYHIEEVEMQSHLQLFVMHYMSFC
jgi:hypothetical protein